MTLEITFPTNGDFALQDLEDLINFTLFDTLATNITSTRIEAEETYYYSSGPYGETVQTVVYGSGFSWNLNSFVSNGYITGLRVIGPGDNGTGSNTVIFRDLNVSVRALDALLEEELSAGNSDALETWLLSYDFRLNLGDRADFLFGYTDEGFAMNPRGDDTIYAGGGNDYIPSGDGDDVVFGEAGFDSLYGGYGDDYLNGGADGDELQGGYGNDRLLGGTGDDMLYGDSGNDRLVGGAGSDALYGRLDNDRLIGGNGADRLYGDEGRDRLIGGRGNDELTGGAGRDKLTGGSGFDTFIFATGDGRNIVTDFNTNTSRETIDLNNVRAIRNYSDLVDNHMVQDGDDVVIQARGIKIRLDMTDIEDLGAGDFIF